MKIRAPTGPFGVRGIACPWALRIQTSKVQTKPCLSLVRALLLHFFEILSPRKEIRETDPPSRLPNLAQVYLGTLNIIVGHNFR